MIQKAILNGRSLKYINRMRNGGSGSKLAVSSMFWVILPSLYFGKRLKNESNRWGLAGVSSTILVEVSTLCFSTLDINSKTTKNFTLKEYFKTNGMGSLMKGFQPLVYGYLMSSFIYFSFYKRIKEVMK